MIKDLNGIEYTVVTAGSLNQIEGMVGMLQCEGSSNKETIAAARKHMAVISAPVLWSAERKEVLVPPGDYAEDVMEFLRRTAR